MKATLFDFSKYVDAYKSLDINNYGTKNAAVNMKWCAEKRAMSKPRYSVFKST